MGYGDYIPSGGRHYKKPITKEQLRKMQQAYAKADEVTEVVRALEGDEQMKTKEEMDRVIRSLL